MGSHPGGVHPVEQIAAEALQDLTCLARRDPGQRLCSGVQPPVRRLECRLDVAPLSDQADHFLDHLVGVGTTPPEERLDPVAVGPGGGQEHRSGEGALPDIRSCGFSDGLLLRDQIESVIGDLEDHPHFPGPSGEGLDCRLVGVGGHRTETSGGVDEGCRLASDHVEIVVDGMGEVIGELKLPGLALDQFCIGGGEESHRLQAEMGGGDLRGPRHEEVPGQDGNGVGPVGVGRGGPAAGVGLVDHIVVIEGSDMDQFHGHPGLDRAAILGRAQLRCEQGEHGAETLAAGEQKVLGDLGQVGVIRRRCLEQALLDTAQALPNSGNRNKTLEVFHW
jgi:hypothetical protein